MHRGSKTYKRAKAIESLKPGATWSAKGKDGENITWGKVSGTPPTLAEIDAEVARLEYQHKRSAAYPPIGEQLDSLYKDILTGKLDSTGEFARGIKAVKQAHPKS